MEILAYCNFKDSEKYKGKLVIEDPNGKKPIKVFLNLLTDSVDGSMLHNLPNNVKCVTVQGMGSILDVEGSGVDVFREVPLESIDMLKDEPGVCNLVRLPDGYCNMRELWNLSRTKNVRFIGGNLLGVKGVSIGRYEEGKEKMSPVFNGEYDVFLESNISDLENLTEKIKKFSKKENGGRSKGEKKQKEPTKKKSKISASINSLFGGTEVDF